MKYAIGYIVLVCMLVAGLYICHMCWSNVAPGIGDPYEVAGIMMVMVGSIGLTIKAILGNN